VRVRPAWRREDRAGTARPDRELLERLSRQGYSHAVVAFVGEDGYPVSVATGFRPLPERGAVLLDPIAGESVEPPLGREVNVVFSHIRPRPGIGYDERRYVSLWGTLRPVEAGLEFVPERVQHWDEQEMPFFEYAERGVPQAHRYLSKLSEATGRRVRPRLSPGWLFLRATRLPFLSATAVPVFLGTAVAALDGRFEWWLALLTLVAGSCVHLGLNVANDVFDTMSGADEANWTPTPYSGGSRVILYGLLSLKEMALLSAALYAVGLGIGLYLAATRAFWPLLAIGAVGTFLSLAYTAPPFRLVHRGVGEVAVGLGFGPLMTLGAYYVQAQRFSWEALYASLPVAILVALILYVNEVPDRPGDAEVGKRTLPVRLSRRAVIGGYAGAVAAAFGLILGGALGGVLALPTLLALAAAPLAIPVLRGLRSFYDDPYGLMPAMWRNIQLHLATGLLLVAGYVVATVVRELRVPAG
jgi:1,4-dihydroxy-2-naphthoate octaprenyltransferase